MARITKAEKEKRVTEVVNLLLKGVKRSDILQYAIKSRWDVSDAMVDKYIRQATEAIKESAEIDRDYEIALAKERYEYLYMQNIVKKDYRSAAQVVKMKAELQGIEAPKKLDHTGELTFNIEEVRRKRWADNAENIKSLDEDSE